MTTARVKHRNYVPYGWIAIEFCNVDFFGSDAERFGSAWRKITYAKYDQVQPEIERIQKHIVKCEEKIGIIGQELNQLRRWWRFWKTPEENELLQKKSLIMHDIMEARARKKFLQRDMFYKARELVCKAEHFLTENGFILTSTSSDGNGCVTHTDLWVKIE